MTSRKISGETELSPSRKMGSESWRFPARHGGYPQIMTFLLTTFKGIFHEINHPAIGVPLCMETYGHPQICWTVRRVMSKMEVFWLVWYCAGIRHWLSRLGFWIRRTRDMALTVHIGGLNPKNRLWPPLTRQCVGLGVSILLPFPHLSIKCCSSSRYYQILIFSEWIITHYSELFWSYWRFNPPKSQ